MKKIILAFSTIAILQSCSKPNVKVVQQAMVYDSINYKGPHFNVNLYTTLNFDENEIDRKTYNDFMVVIEKDTFPLVPAINYFKVKTVKGNINIDYLSLLNFKSKIYENDSLLQIIKNKSKVIDSEGKIIRSEGILRIESYIVMHKNKKSNHRYE